jgi:hypothetical protein
VCVSFRSALPARLEQARSWLSPSEKTANGNHYPGYSQDDDEGQRKHAKGGSGVDQGILARAKPPLDHPKAQNGGKRQKDGSEGINWRLAFHAADSSKAGSSGRQLTR